MSHTDDFTTTTGRPLLCGANLAEAQLQPPWGARQPEAPFVYSWQFVSGNLLPAISTEWRRTCSEASTIRGLQCWEGGPLICESQVGLKQDAPGLHAWGQ